MSITHPTFSETDNEIRVRILKVAVKLFAKQGYQGTSVQEIVTQAKTTKPMLYYYFKNKEGLYRELIVTFYEQIRKRLNDIDTRKGTTKAKLIAVVDANFEMVRQHPDLSWFGFVSFFAPVKDAPKVKVQELGEANFEVLQKIIEDGVEQGEVVGHSGEIALALSGLIVIYIMTEILKPGLNILAPDHAERLVNLLYEGVRSRS